MDDIALVVSHIKKLPVNVAGLVFGINPGTARRYISRYRKMVSDFLVDDCKLVRFKDPEELRESLPTGVVELVASGVLPAVKFDGTYFYTDTPQWAGLNIQFFCPNKGDLCAWLVCVCVRVSVCMCLCLCVTCVQVCVCACGCNVTREFSISDAMSRKDLL